MTVKTAKENLEQYFKLYKKTNTTSIKKTKSLLEQLRTWARNHRMKTKQAKSFRDFHAANQVRFFEEIFDETHEKIIAFNVLLALFKLNVIRFENFQLVHDTPKAEEVIAMMFAQNKKEEVLHSQINM